MFIIYVHICAYIYEPVHVCVCCGCNLVHVGIFWGLELCVRSMTKKDDIIADVFIGQSVGGSVFSKNLISELLPRVKLVSKETISVILSNNFESG